MPLSLPALVIGGGHNGLGVIRTLGRLGIPVYCLVENGTDYAVYSKYCYAHFVVSGVETRLDPVRTTLPRVARQIGGPFYVHPTSDMAVLHLTQLPLNPQQYLTSLPSHAAAETVIKKRKFYQSLHDLEVPHPTTVFSDAEEMDVLTSRLTFPVFIKPSLSQLFFQQYRVKGFVAYSRRELDGYLTQVRHHGLDVMIQQIVRGPPRNHYYITGYFSKDGRLTRVMARRNLRQPHFFSVSSAIESIPMTATMHRLRRVIETYLTAIEYRGCFSAEFKQDAVTGDYLLLEVNARTGWYNIHEATCGINGTLTAYREAIGDVIEEHWTYSQGVSGIEFMRDLQSMVMMIRRGTLDYHDVLRSYLQPTAWLIYARDDPQPFFTRLRFLLREQLHPRGVR